MFNCISMYNIKAIIIEEIIIMTNLRKARKVIVQSDRESLKLFRFPSYCDVRIRLRMQTITFKLTSSVRWNTNMRDNTDNERICRLISSSLKFNPCV